MGEAVPLSLRELSEGGGGKKMAEAEAEAEAEEVVVGSVVEREEGGYMCHMCDPWAHRRLLMRLRAKYALE